MTPEREPEKRLPHLWKAAGARITQSYTREVVTRNNDIGINIYDWNERTLKHFSSIHWRASLVPAAAVIPAPTAYIKVAAVKTLVVVVQLYASQTLVREAFSFAEIRFCQNLEERLVFQAVIIVLPSMVFNQIEEDYCRVFIILNRNSRGYTYFNVRGEIPRFLKDDQLRKHSPSDFSLIKNES